ncbi:Panacea domain-containing protein [Bradyrhizobium sp. 930_D9_N1_4]|uniref:Panacea domain-containing protein n=1 Tax=Bradyrhizobium sp. 930_D9_N1_4 TaxID=3240374 RepID=UPI003F8A7160
MAYDVRSISNFVLDVADVEGRPVSNLSINKIVYFLHSNYLVEFGKPLVSAKIEAWEYGPVFRELYREFKKYGERAISGRAQRISVETGNSETCNCELSELEQSFLEPMIRRYVRFSASTLVSMSHVPGGPWDQIWNHGTVTQPSMRISDDLILAWHKAAARH